MAPFILFGYSNVDAAIFTESELNRVYCNETEETEERELSIHIVII